MSIRIYNRTTTTIDLVSEFDNYSEVVFSRLWSGIGTFTIMTNIDMPYATDLTRGRIIMVDGDPKKTGIICEVIKEFDAQNPGKMTVRGRELKWITNRRVITPPSGSQYYSASTYPDAALKSLVCSQMGPTCALSVRQDPLLTVETAANLGGTYVLNSRFDRLDEICTTISEESGIGWWIELGTNSYQLKCALGTDRTAEIRLNPDLDTLKSGKLVETDTDYKNYCYAEGSGSIIAQYTGATEPTGLDRYEMYEDASDTETATDLELRAAQSLVAAGYVRTLTGSAAQTDSYTYGEDYFLGDIVSVDLFGTVSEAQIVGVQESWSFGRYDLKFTFDKPYAEFPLSARRRMDRLARIMRYYATKGLSANISTTQGDIIITTQGDYLVMGG